MYVQVEKNPQIFLYRYSTSKETNNGIILSNESSYKYTLDATHCHPTMRDTSQRQ